MEERLERWSEILKVLGDKSRMRILCALIRNPRSPSEISQELGIEISLVCHHLRVLKHLGIVEAKREGKKKIYKVRDEYVRKLITFCLLEE